MIPSGAMVSGNSPPKGMGRPGHASCQRISIASSPPTSRKKRLKKRNWIPMTLWSEEKMYFRMKDIS
jgi:hypothetical protein